MKIVKLNRRYKAFAQGFTHALKFEQQTWRSREVETILRARYVYNGGDPAWQACAGKRIPSPTRYGLRRQEWWINLRHESDITLILLMVDH
jgi:hypothetical protein